MERRRPGAQGGIEGVVRRSPLNMKTKYMSCVNPMSADASSGLVIVVLVFAHITL
jgi:hypothetical protein